MNQQGRLIAVAHDLRSLQNVGAIFRTADGAGFDEVITSGYTGAPPDPRIAKVALGAEEALDHRAAADIPQLLDLLEGSHVIVLEQHPRSVRPSELALPAPHVDIAVVACSELEGASPELLARADTIVELPMRGMKESLNVAMAFGIVSYAIAELRFPGDARRSRQPPRPVREGVLTRGVTTTPPRER